MTTSATEKRIKTSDEPPFVPKVLLWLVGAAMPVASLGLDVFVGGKDRLIGRDFTNLWTAGKLAIDGKTDCAFQLTCFRQALTEHTGIISKQNFSYPPHAFLIDVPFAILPYYAALFIWTLLGILFFIACARPYLPEKLPPILSALTPAGLFTIWDGQYGYFFGGLWLLTFSSLAKHQSKAGLAAGIMTIKPHLGILLALVMVVRKRWITITFAASTTLMLVALSGAIFGFDNWVGFFTETTKVQTEILNRETPQFYFRMMPTAYPTMGSFVQAGFAAFAMACLWRIRRVSFMNLAFPTATSTFLILPYAFNYDMTVVCLGYAVILYSQWSKLTLLQKMIFVGAFMAPQVSYAAAFAVPFILAAALWEQTRLILAQPREMLLAEQAPISTQTRMDVSLDKTNQIG